MPRAPRRCIRPDCDELVPCPDHTPKPWTGSTRRSRLPPDWEQRRVATRNRAQGQCEGLSFNGEPRWHVETCDGTGRECDHDKRGDDHSLTNLRWLSDPCHAHKTASGR